MPKTRYQIMEEKILGVIEDLPEHSDGYGVRMIVSPDGKIQADGTPFIGRELVRKRSTIQRAERHNEYVHESEDEARDKIREICDLYGFSDDELREDGRCVWNLANAVSHRNLDNVEAQLAYFEKNFRPYRKDEE